MKKLRTAVLRDGTAAIRWVVDAVSHACSNLSSLRPSSNRGFWAKLLVVFENDRPATMTEMVSAEVRPLSVFDGKLHLAGGPASRYSDLLKILTLLVVLRRS